jgi:hypothetical protein
MILKRLAGLACLASMIWGAPSPPASAHEIRPAIVTAVVTPERYDITFVANLEALLAGIGPQHNDTSEAATAAVYDGLRVLQPAELKQRFEAFAPKWLQGVQLAFDGKRVTPQIAGIEVPEPGDLGLARLSTIRLAGATPPGAHDFSWQYSAELGTSVLRVRGAEGEHMVSTWLKDGTASERIPVAGATPKSTLQVLLDYVGLGFTHILPLGVDHILFVLGLYLLSPDWRPLLVQVTAFTIAHSFTLALGLYGVVQMPSSIVEPLIAASIVYVAVENLLTGRLHSWRPLVVFGFGLLHGLGFAGVLHEIGLPRDQFVTALIGFNVGVELGQLAVIGLAFAATGLWFRARPWYRTRIVMPASAAIALVGLFWTVERVIAG